jgi:hypothetical protein
VSLPFYDLGKMETIKYQDLEDKGSSIRAVDPGASAKTAGLREKWITDSDVHSTRVLYAAENNEISV